MVCRQHWETKNIQYVAWIHAAILTIIDGSSRPGPNGLGLIGSSECGGSRLLLALSPAGDALLATVGNLKAFPHILCPVSVWCCQVGFIVSHSEVISFMYVGKLGSWPTIG